MEISLCFVGGNWKTADQARSELHTRRYRYPVAFVTSLPSFWCLRCGMAWLITITHSFNIHGIDDCPFSKINATIFFSIFNIYTFIQLYFTLLCKNINSLIYFVTNMYYNQQCALKKCLKTCKRIQTYYSQ